MPCPNYGVLEKNLTFSIQARSSSGAPVDADSLPAYKVYEDETGTEIVSGTMALLDDANTTGFYSEQLAVTTANGYERLKTYTIRITTAISAVSVAKALSFICMGEADVTVASGDALTTTARFKTYAGITSADDDTLIGLLIARATGAIQNYCERTLVSTTHRDFYDGFSGDMLVLDNYPVTAIQMLSGARQTAFGLMNTSTDAYHAMASVTTTGLRLLVQGGDNADDTTLTLASYSTLTDLFTAITSLAKGWGILQNSTLNVWSPTELLPTTMGSSCLNTYADIYIPDDPLNGFVVNSDAGVVRVSGFSRSFQGITIRYTAGYSSIPADLEQICIDLVGIYYDSRKINLMLSSENIGDYSYVTKAGKDNYSKMPLQITQRLQPWRSHRL